MKARMIPKASHALSHSINEPVRMMQSAVATAAGGEDEIRTHEGVTPFDHSATSPLGADVKRADFLAGFGAGASLKGRVAKKP